MATADGEAFRDCLVDIVDDCRAIADDDFGTRRYTVSTVVRVWDTAVGSGSYTDTETVLSPRPRVREPSPYFQNAEGGRYEAGDRIVDKLSATLTRDDLTGGKLGPLSEFFWLINGEKFSIVGEPSEKFAGYRVTLRRMRRSRRS